MIIKDIFLYVNVVYTVTITYCYNSPHSSRVEQNTVNIKVECSNHSEGFPVD